MGLETRRKIKELEEQALPGRVAEIEEICGKAVPYDVDWASFGDDLEALNFVDNVSCHRLNMALRVICSDDLGKEAVRDALKKVTIKNVGSVDTKSLGFADGTLQIACCYNQGLTGAFSDNEIRELLLKHL